MPFNFKGGIHPEGKKRATIKKAIEELDAPREVIIPLLMSRGKINSPIVEVGDRVKLGQRIGESTSAFSAPCHASVSGTVTAIEPRLHPNGEMVLSVVIENDFKDEREEVSPSHDKFMTMTAQELSSICRDCGIVGLSGSAGPLSEKIIRASGKVNTLIINGAECEPYITADNRVMIEYTDELYDGAQVIARALGIKESYIAVESDKPAAIAELRRYLAKKPGVHLVILQTKYPQGDERQIVKTVTGREIPPGGEGADVGVICVNVSTAVAVARAVHEGEPLTSRVVTVSGGAVANPKNLLVRIGTPISELFSACGGFLEHPGKVIMGGPMMGQAEASLDVPVIKGTNCVLAFYDYESAKKLETTCIHCGKCVSACPMSLMPLYIYRAYREGELSVCEEYNIGDCTECGACAYICPANISLVAAFGAAKRQIEKKKAEEGQNED